MPGDDGESFGCIFQVVYVCDQAWEVFFALEYIVEGGGLTSDLLRLFGVGNNLFISCATGDGWEEANEAGSRGIGSHVFEDLVKIVDLKHASNLARLPGPHVTYPHQ